MSPRFTDNLKSFFKEKKRSLSNLGQIFTKNLEGSSFSSKVKIRAMPSRPSEYIPGNVERTVKKFL